jgi:hypothetical protein
MYVAWNGVAACATPFWRERNSLSVTDSYRGRSGDEGRVNVLSANVSALVYTTRNSGALGREVPLNPIQERDAAGPGGVR